MEDKPKIEIQVDEVADVWVAWTNTDCTEGRGYEVPLHVAGCMETAVRLGRRGSVQGCDCRVTKAQAFRIKGEWFVPGRITHPTKEDIAQREQRDARESALARAKAAGLSDADLALLQKP